MDFLGVLAVQMRRDVFDSVDNSLFVQWSIVSFEGVSTKKTISYYMYVC